MSFWDFRDDATRPGAGILHIDGEIAAQESWWDSGRVVARDFRRALDNYDDVTVYINSPGGDVYAGAELYTALREHKGQVRVIVSGIAASAASVVAMAGSEVLMSPVAYMMIHDPWTMTAGDARAHDHMAQVLREIGEGIIAAYVQKSGKTRDEIAAMMADETYMSAQRCVDEGFADGLLKTENEAASSGQSDRSNTLMRARSSARQAIHNLCRVNGVDPMGERERAEIAERSEIILRAAISAQIANDKGGKQK